MKPVCVLILLAAVGVALSGDPPTKPAPIPADVDIVARLRDALKTGTPAEKQAALDSIRALKPITLVPDVIDAIEDATAYPPSTDPKCRSGWNFVGHHAATVMGEIARAIDGVELGLKPGDRAYRPYSFHDDLTDGPTLKAAGRLAAVRKNWAAWWDAPRKAVADEPPKAGGLRGGKKLRFPEEGVAAGVKATVALLESCTDRSDDTLAYKPEDLENSTGDHVRIVFPKPITIAGGVTVSELVFVLPVERGVFWFRSGDKILRHTKFVHTKEAAFSAWLRTAMTDE